MKNREGQQVWLAISCVLCILIEVRNTAGVDGTEFSGGWLTGPLLSMADVGTLLFVVAPLAAVAQPRVGAIAGLSAALLTLPLYLFFVAPLPFNEAFGFGHVFKVQPAPGLHFESWSVAGLVMIAVTGFLCVRRGWESVR